MKYIAYLANVLAFFCIAYSCSQEKSGSDDFTEESFKESFHLVDGRTYKNDSLIVKMLIEIKFHPDSFLVILDMETSDVTKIIDLKNNKIQDIIPQGRGPGEMVNPVSIDILGNDLYVFCGQLRKVIIFSPDSNRQFQLIREFNLDEKRTVGFFPLKENIMLCLSNLGDPKRLTFLDEKGKILRKTGDYPTLLNSNGLQADNNIFYSFILGRPDGERFLLECTRTDVLELYDTDKGLLKRFQGPIGIKLSAINQNVGVGTMIQTEPSYVLYGKGDANENEFWASFSGFKIQKDRRPSTSESFQNRILCFDWNGKPLRTIEFDYSFLDFDVDWKNKVLYTLSWKNGDSEIVIYPLNSILK